MKISGSHSIVTVSPHRKEFEKPESGEVAQDKHVREADLQSAGLKDSIDGSSSVDMELVERVKGEIARGEVTLDPAKLAEAIMGIHTR